MNLKNPKIMTVEEYKKWTTERDPNPANWDIDLCKAADAHIKEVTTLNFEQYLHDNNIKGALETWCIAFFKHHFGYAETDYLCQALNLYPSYMAVNKII